MRARHAVPLAVLAWPFVEPLFPVLRRTTVAVLPPDVQPLTVLHLSDLHLLPRHHRRSDWVRALTRHRPDLVVSTGDHLSSAAAIGLLTRTLGVFDAPAYFVPGNNDYHLPRVPRPWDYLRDNGSSVRRRRPDLPWREAARALEVVGWTDLTGRRVQALPGVLLTGTDDAHLRRDRYQPARLAGFGIGVTHTPADRLLTAFADDGHALVLAGHTHGGQLRLPGFGPFTSNCDLPLDRARGLTRDARGWLHVSAGLGASPYLPVRCCCRPEATLLRLVPAVG
jgi:predicted MPP superfamily phosphohydrolase